MGTLGCIVNTISKVDEKIKEIRECKSRLRSFNWQLEDAYLELRVWHSIWIGKKAFPRDTYVHFWGIEGLDDIQSRVGGITELSDEIKVLLRQPGINETGKSLSHSELKVWHDLIDRDVAELPSWGYLDHRKAGLVHKIGLEWAIELGPPDAGYALDLWSEVDRMYIDFMVRDTALDVETRASRVRISVEEKPAQTGFIVQRVHDVVLSHQEHLPEFSRLFSLLEKPARRSRSLRKMLTEGIALAKIALALPISVILEQEDTSYVVGEELVSQKRLLGMLRERFGRNTITKAISYCLDPNTANLGDSLAYHFEEYCQNVVSPLDTYYKTVSKHFQTSSGKVLSGSKDLSRYYDMDYDSDLTENTENGNEESSSYNEDEDEAFSNDDDDA
ncbi:MAG: hypothetical protein ASARMPRED_001336 [Alectoria sarmentosa]|nr:MAG: hypothetical protein ASARMPRED_001336 [Alectoria sarmentosa]